MKMKFGVLLWLVATLTVIYCPKVVAQRGEIPSWANSEPLMPFSEIANYYETRSWLISGIVTKTQQTPEDAIITIQIDRIYAGPKALQDMTVDLRFDKDNRHVMLYDSKYLNAFAKGQRILSSISSYNEGIINYSRRYGFPLPTILDDSPTARDLEKHADNVKAIYFGAKENRILLIKQYAHSNIPFTTVWATNAIGGWRTDEGNDILKQLAKDKDRKLLSQLIAIDRSLRNGYKLDQWRDSPEQLDLINRIKEFEPKGDIRYPDF